LRYEVRVTGADGRLVCGATLRCADVDTALQRFRDLPLPDGEAELRRHGRLLARRPGRLGMDGAARAQG
jgi:hypothetical protein